MFKTVATRGHSAKILKSTRRLDLRRHFFSERVINRWNSQSINQSSEIFRVA